METTRVTLLIVCLLTLASCATGSSIVTGKVRPAIDPNDVMLYLEPPLEYETIGIVEASSEVEISSQAAQDRAIQELKTQAAKIGANGVLITNTGEKSGDIVGFFFEGFFYGGASDARPREGERYLSFKNKHNKRMQSDAATPRR